MKIRAFGGLWDFLVGPKGSALIKRLRNTELTLPLYVELIKLT
jgi:hypothetical protein